MKIQHLQQKDLANFRKKLLLKQKGKCLICKKEVVRAVLDHSHVKRIKGSGRLRGVICSSCNILLGKAENNSVRYGVSQKELPTILRAMADYLEKEHLPYMHPSEAPPIKRLSKRSYNSLIKEIIKINNKQEIKLIRIPEYPRSGKLTLPLKKLYARLCMTPQFYK